MQTLPSPLTGETIYGLNKGVKNCISATSTKQQHRHRAASIISSNLISTILQRQLRELSKLVHKFIILGVTFDLTSMMIGMGKRELYKPGKVGVFKNFIIFNLAAVIGFILGSVAFTVSMLVFPNPTFAWLFANGVGGISHFGANYIMQKQTKEKIVQNFIVFNATGLIGFFMASVAFGATIIFIQDSTVAWLIGSAIGTIAHFILNDKATNFKLKIRLNFKRQHSAN